MTDYSKLTAMLTGILIFIVAAVIIGNATWTAVLVGLGVLALLVVGIFGL